MMEAKMELKQMIEKLNHHQTTSVELVKEAIQLHDQFRDKNAIGSVNPKALQMAEMLDLERQNGQLRSPLHGIPIAIKDNILYNDGTPTTCNSYAFKDFYAPFNATVVESIIQAGMIPLFKANLSEFAYFMSEHAPSGYGSMYGQVKHPFDESIDPLGSSTGSAVAVKLGIVPIAIGSETNGSLMAPAYQCQIVSFKPTFGLVSKYGIIPISHTQDTAGPMGNHVLDCALLFDQMMTQDSNDSDTLQHPIKPVSEHIESPLEASKIGLLYFSNYEYDEINSHIMTEAAIRLEAMGHTVVKITIEHPKMDNEKTLLVEFKAGMNNFLSSVQPHIHLKTLSELIAFHEANAERCLKYGQTILVDSDQTSGYLLDEAYLSERQALLSNARMLEDILYKEDLVAVASPLWLSFAPIFGNPSVCIPAGIYDHKPKAMVFVGKRYDDENVLRLTHQYETYQK